MAVLQTSMHSVILFFVNFEKCEEKKKRTKSLIKTSVPPPPTSETTRFHDIPLVLILKSKQKRRKKGQNKVSICSSGISWIRKTIVS